MDEQAIARYRYMLRTAPPEDIERVYEEAFARLTPEQRQRALRALAQHVPPSEISGDDPASLARTATRAEIQQPGTIERAWGSGAAAGFGLGGWFLPMLAGTFIGTSLAQAFFDHDGGPTGDTAGDVAADANWQDPRADAGGYGEGDPGDYGGGNLGDLGGGDLGGGDFGF